MLHIDVAKVNRDVAHVAYVASVLDECWKRLFKMFSSISDVCLQAVYTKIWREKRGNSKLPKLCRSWNRLHEDRYQLIQI